MRSSRGRKSSAFKSHATYAVRQLFAVCHNDWAVALLGSFRRFSFRCGDHCRKHLPWLTLGRRRSCPLDSTPRSPRGIFVNPSPPEVTQTLQPKPVEGARLVFTVSKE